MNPPKLNPKPGGCFGLTLIRRTGFPFRNYEVGQVKVVRALYSYTAQREDELSFHEGDILYVFDQISDPDWWKARCGKKTGAIPSNYVEAHTEIIDTPLHEAARRGNLNFLQQCLQQGVSATGLDSVGNTALYWASLGGHLDCVKELLSIPKLPLNAQNKIGESALHAASSRGHSEIVALLLAEGADATIRNIDGETADSLATPAVRALLAASRHSSKAIPAYSYKPQDYADDSD